MRDYNFKRRAVKPVYPTASLLSEAMAFLGFVAGLAIVLVLLVL